MVLNILEKETEELIGRRIWVWDLVGWVYKKVQGS